MKRLTILKSIRPELKINYRVFSQKNQLERRIKRLRLDHGGEYFPKIFDEFCEEHGIIHERTPPYSPESNGIAERKNRTLTDLVNAMLDTGGLSKAWWGEALLTASHVLNKVPNRNKEHTPYEIWMGKNHRFLTCAHGDIWQRSIFQSIRNVSWDLKQWIMSL